MFALFMCFYYKTTTKFWYYVKKIYTLAMFSSDYLKIRQRNGSPPSNPDSALTKLAKISVFVFLGYHFVDLYRLIRQTPLKIESFYAVVNG